MLSKRISSMLLGGAAVAGLASAAQASLVVDLRAVSATGGAVLVNAKSVTIVGQTGTITFEIHAVVNAPDNGNTQDDGPSAVVGSMLSTNIPAKGNMVATVAQVWRGSASSDGLVQDLDADGDLDVGSNTVASTANFFAARNTELGFRPGDQVLGTLVMTLTSATLFSGDTLAQFRPRIATASAGWTENGVGKSTGGTNQFLSGTDVVLSTGIPEPTSIGLIGLAGLGMLARRRK